MYLHIEISQIEAAERVTHNEAIVLSFDDAHRQHFAISFEGRDFSSTGGSGGGGGVNLKAVPPIEINGDQISHKKSGVDENNVTDPYGHCKTPPHPLGGDENTDFTAANVAVKSLTINGVLINIDDMKLKLDKAVWDAEFEVTEEALVHKRTALFKSLVVFDEYSEGGGGGGADLPVGVLGDVLYHDGADWVAKQANTLGFATQTWVEAKGYATQTWVNSNDFATKLWVAEQNFATTVQLNTKLDKTIWEREFTPTDDAVEVNRNMAFRKQLIFEEYTDVPVGGTSNYPDLTNLPTIGGVTVLGGRTLTDYGLGTYDFATQAWANVQFALKTQIPSLTGYATQTWVAQQGYATQTWVTNKGYLTGITKAQVLGVMSGSGSSSEYLAGNGTFYTVGYGELSGRPDLSVYATTSWVGSNYLILTGGTMAGDIAMSRNSIHGINCLTIDGDRLNGSASSPSYRRLVFGGYYASNNHGYAQIVMPETSQTQGVGELQFLVRGTGGSSNNYPLTKYMSIGGIAQDIQVNSIITFNDTARFNGQVVFDNY